MNRNYTSARIRSINKGDWTYGRFEIRAKTARRPRTVAGHLDDAHRERLRRTWAASGEIDIMELVGSRAGQSFMGRSTTEDDGPTTWSRGASYRLPEGKFSDDFHTFTLLWREGEMRWFVDGQLYTRIS
jgi:beta-glucanase (GH16 family)